MLGIFGSTRTSEVMDKKDMEDAFRRLDEVLGEKKVISARVAVGGGCLIHYLPAVTKTRDNVNFFMTDPPVIRKLRANDLALLSVEERRHLTEEEHYLGDGEKRFDDAIRIVRHEFRDRLPATWMERVRGIMLPEKDNAEVMNRCITQGIGVLDFTSPRSLPPGDSAPPPLKYLKMYAIPMEYAFAAKLRRTDPMWQWPQPGQEDNRQELVGYLRVYLNRYQRFQVAPSDIRNWLEQLGGPPFEDLKSTLHSVNYWWSQIYPNEPEPILTTASP
jgi:hypothetical protein